jgi:hypothetical protein
MGDTDIYYPIYMGPEIGWTTTGELHVAGLILVPPTPSPTFLPTTASPTAFMPTAYPSAPIVVQWFLGAVKSDSCDGICASVSKTCVSSEFAAIKTISSLQSILDIGIYDLNSCSSSTSYLTCSMATCEGGITTGGPNPWSYSITPAKWVPGNICYVSTNSNGRCFVNSDDFAGGTEIGHRFCPCA